MSNYGGLSTEHLRQFIERIERLEVEKKNIADDIKDVYQEAKANGFDTKAMREVIKIRKMDASELEEQEYLLDTYKRALGLLPVLDGEQNNSLGCGTVSPSIEDLKPIGIECVLMTIDDI